MILLAFCQDHLRVETVVMNGLADVLLVSGNAKQGVVLRAFYFIVFTLYLIQIALLVKYRGDSICDHL